MNRPLFTPCEHLFTKANANPIQAKTVCLAEQLLKNQSSKHGSFWVSLDRPPPTRPGRQAIRRSNCFITIPIPYHVPQRWGLPQGGGGDSQVWTPSRIIPNHSTVYTSQGFQIIISDWMRSITHQRAYPAIQFEWISWMKQENGGGGGGGVNLFMGESEEYITVL